MSPPAEYVLTSGEINRCWTFAKRVAATYETEAKAASLANTVDNNTRDKRERAWLYSRAAEWGMCRMLNVDPIKALDWNFEVDRGFDFEWNGWFIDVKASGANTPRLIWPVTKAHLIDEGNFDFMALCRVELPRITCLGFIHRNLFADTATVSDGLDGLVRGTPWVHARDLTPLSEFAAMPAS